MSAGVREGAGAVAREAGVAVREGGPAVRCVAAGRVVTCDAARATAANPLGVIERGAVAMVAAKIVAVGEEAELRARFPEASWETYADAVMTPGLVDAHTHAAWMGARDGEYAMRMAGADYEAIAKAGGGIVASMRAIRAASVEEITAGLAARLRRMAAMGVTTVEVKSGYGLDEEGELKQLEAIRSVAERARAEQSRTERTSAERSAEEPARAERVSAERASAERASAEQSRADRVGDALMRAGGLPRVVATFLALHALPPEAKGDRDGYAKHVTEKVLPGVAARGLATFVDAYVDRSAFSVGQTRPLLERARALGLGVRLHAGQFADVGGAELAADMSAASADHLEAVGPAGIARMAEAGVRAVLLPVASFTLRQEAPPIAALRAAGVGLVVASDANPGTAPTESLPLALALAVRNYGLTVAEALLGATREAAASLGLAESTGVLREGFSADVVVWDHAHENGIVQPWGVPRARAVWREGLGLLVG